MSTEAEIKKIPLGLISALFLAGLFVVITTAYVNIGIIAMDDYTDIIARIVPAGVQDNSHLIAASGIRTPIPSILLAKLAGFAQSIGLRDPANQLRFVLILLGTWSYAAGAFAAITLFRSRRRWETAAALFLMGFYFLSPLALTRPMFESLCAPFLVLSALSGQHYLESKRPIQLVIALILLTAASLFRFQAGVCILALVALPFLTRRPKDLLFLAATASLCFLTTGLFDLWLRGEFHASLKAYLHYNLNYSSTYGMTPFYTFGLLLVVMTIPPFFFSRYAGFRWRTGYRGLLVPLLYFILFVVAHSVVPHKEERFMIPILPLFLILLAPLAAYFIEKKAKIRIGIFLGLNFILLFLTSYNIAQNNVVELGIFLHQHPKIHTVKSVGSTLVLTPQAYIARDIEWKAFDSKMEGCQSVVVCRSDLVAQVPELEKNFELIRAFKPGFLESILVRLNPSKNFRRGSIELFAPKGCGL
jgi:hypothetical protein